MHTRTGDYVPDTQHPISLGDSQIRPFPGNVQQGTELCASKFSVVRANSNPVLHNFSAALSQENGVLKTSIPLAFPEICVRKQTREATILFPKHPLPWNASEYFSRCLE